MEGVKRKPAYPLIVLLSECQHDTTYEEIRGKEVTRHIIMREMYM